MTFQAKSTTMILIALLVVYGAYFLRVATWVATTPVEEIVYQPLMIGTAIPLILLLAITHAGLAIRSPSEVSQADERDRDYSVRAEAVGGYVLGFGVVAGLALAMADTDPFWTAHALLAALVASEIVAASFRLILYRRGH